MTVLTVVDNDDGLLHLEGPPLSVLGLAHVDTYDGASLAVDLLTFDLHAVTVDLDAADRTPELLCRTELADLRLLEPGDRLDVEWGPDDGKAVLGVSAADALDPLHPAAGVLRAEVERLAAGRPLAELLPAVDTVPVDADLVVTLAWTSLLSARKLLSFYARTPVAARLSEVVEVLTELTPPASGLLAPGVDEGDEGGDSSGRTVVSLGTAGAGLVGGALGGRGDEAGLDLPALADLASAGPEVIPNLVGLRARRVGDEVTVAAAPLAHAGPGRLWSRLWTTGDEVGGLAALQAGDGGTMTATLPAHPDAAWVELTADPTTTPVRARVAQRQLRVVLQEHRQRAALANLAQAVRLEGADALGAQARRVQRAGRLDPGLVLGVDRFPVFGGPGAAPSDIALVGELADPGGDGLRDGVRPAFGPHA